MVALVVVLTTALCAAVALGSPEIEENVYSPFEDSWRLSQQFRVVDGEEACPEQFRHQARIIGDENVQWAGSLIKPTAVLTDAAIWQSKKFTIYLGTIFLEGDESTFKVESIWALQHPEFNHSNLLVNNVAVILLNVEVPLGRHIWPVKLPSVDEVSESFTGRRALISGFGVVKTDVLRPEKILRVAEVTVISNDLCQMFYKDNDIPDSALCAGNAKSGLCHGDFGSALVVQTGGQYTQIGIASYHSGKCEDEIPGVYTRVTSFLEWIQRAAGDLDNWRGAVDAYSE